MTDEEPEVVLEWLAKMKPTYPIAITRGGFEQQIGVPHFPYSAVIDAQGNIAYAGNAGEGEGVLETALAASKKKPLWPKSLAKVTKLMMGDPVKAYAELQKLVAGGKIAEPDKPYVDSFLLFLEDQAKTALEDAKALRDAGHVWKAVQKIEVYSAAKPPFPTSEDSLGLLKELQALPDFKKELAGGEAFAEGEKLAKDGEFLEAFEAYKSVSKKFAGTKIGANARTQAEQIRSSGMPGFESACESCRMVKRACEKHRKEVKL